jgi:hypothetical protein
MGMLATARKSFKKIQEIVKKAFSNKSLKGMRCKELSIRQRREAGSSNDGPEAANAKAPITDITGRGE